MLLGGVGGTTFHKDPRYPELLVSFDLSKSSVSDARRFVHKATEAFPSDYLTGMGVYLFVQERVITVYLAVDATQVTTSGSKLDDYATFLEKTGAENKSIGAVSMVTLTQEKYNRMWRSLLQADLKIASVTDSSIDEVFDQVEGVWKSR